MKEKMKCSECEFCNSFRPYGNSRASFRCKHPDQHYIFRNIECRKIQDSWIMERPGPMRFQSRPLQHGVRKSAKTNKSGLCVVFLLYV